jgi:chemosensory pili system protein ChpA (sensor histidine kinase/response regulator)
MERSGLSWIKAEIDAAVKQACVSLENYAEEGGEPRALDDCATAINSVSDILKTLRLPGGELLASTLQEAIPVLGSKSVGETRCGQQRLLESILKLRKYLEWTMVGHPDTPIVLFSTINELRSAVGLNVVSEEAMLPLDLRVEIPIVEAKANLPPDLRRYAKRLRSAYQQGLLLWLRGSRQGLALLQNVLRDLGETFSNYSFGRVWWAARGLVEALYDGGLETDDSIKSFFREGDRQLRHLAEKGDPALADVFSPQALRTVLHHVMHARSNGAQVKCVRAVFGLEKGSVGAGELQNAMDGFSGPDLETFVAVAKLVEEDIKTAKGTLEIYAHSGEGSAKDLHELGDTLGRLLDIFETLGLSRERDLITDQVRIVKGCAEGKTRLSQENVQFIADGLIRIESALRHIEAWGFKIPSSKSTGQAKDEFAAGLTLSVTDLGEIRALIAKEAKADLAFIKDLIVLCRTSMPESDQMASAASLLDQMAGSLAVAELEEASRLIGALSSYLGHALPTSGADSSTATLEALAEAVIATEDYLQALEEKQEDAPSLLKIAEEKLRTLPARSVSYTKEEAAATSTLESPRPAVGKDVVKEPVPVSTDALGLSQDEDDSTSTAIGDTSKQGAISLEEGAFVPPPLRQDKEGQGGPDGGLQQGVSVAVESPQAEDSALAPKPIGTTDGTAPAVERVSQTEAGKTGGSDSTGNSALPLEHVACLVNRMDPEIAEIFAEEAQEVLEVIHNELPRWKHDSSNAEALAAVRRAFHTLKGSGRLAGAAEIGELSWGVENVLNRVIDGMLTVEPTIFLLLDEVLSVLPQLLNSYKLGRSGDLDLGALIRKIETCSIGGKDPTEDEYHTQSNTNTISQATQEPSPAGAIPAGGLDAVQVRSNAECRSGHAEFFPVTGSGSGASDEQQRGDAKIGIISSAAHPRSQQTAIPDRHEGFVPSVKTPPDPVLLGLFITEARAHLTVLSRFLERCRQGESTAVIDEDVSRALHTLHGNARTAGIQPIMRLVGEVEANLKELRGLELAPSGAHFQAVANAIEQLEEVLTSLEFSEARLAGEMDVPPPSAGSVPAEAHLGKGSSGGGGQGLSGAVEDGVDTTREPITAGHVEHEVLYDRDLIAVFLEEAGEILDLVDPLIDEWRKAPNNRGIIHELQRNLHTLKGGARMSGLRPMGDLSHALESLLTAAHDERLPATGELIDQVQKTEDRLLEMLQQAREQTVMRPAEDLIFTLHELLANGGEATSGPGPARQSSEQTATINPMQPDKQSGRTEGRLEDDARGGESPNRAQGVAAQVRVNPVLVEKVATLGGEVSIARARIGQQIGVLRFNLNEMDETLDRLREQLRRMEIETEAQVLFRHEQSTSVEHEKFDPLELDRYSQVQQLSRSVMESVNDLVSIRELLEGWTGESETLLLQQARVVTELQQGLLAMRLVPFGGIVPRMRHLVRQTARELNKKVQLRFSGAETEIDRIVLNRLGGCLEHMLRNAIDHGIESEDVRTSLGKAVEGTILLSVAREGSEIVLVVEDDGAGLPFEHIRKKSVERGLVRPDENLSQHELAQFILEPAFSTASKLSQISGRGVGMDVVNTEIAQLGGNLEIDSTCGQGTTFRVRLPFALSVTQALMVKIDEAAFAIPHDSVEAVVRISQQEGAVVGSKTAQEITYRDQTYRLCHLGQLLGYAHGGSVTGVPYSPVLFVRAGEHRVAFQVDELSGSQEIIIKPVGPVLATVRWLSGATILPDGNVRLVLDMPSLVRLAMDEQQDVKWGKRADSGGMTASKQVAGPTVLVVDDSITVRKVTARLLESEGMRVVTAKDGIDAVSTLENEMPDIMLLDVEMPRMDGYELATQVRNDSRLKHLPMIMITSRTAEKHRERAREIGVNLYFGKPYSEEELLGGIHELLAGA